ncbi:MAG: hypothetical protein HYT88_01310 [Candidatus Omnitrophica bacterium]|nr:hypothetical protein [Candidatus Omnitrophota bacterium]MBI3009419.1 hypothetical protein [Candidatus Omnitrophota bacterium]
MSPDGPKPLPEERLLGLIRQRQSGQSQRPVQPAASAATEASLGSIAAGRWAHPLGRRWRWVRLSIAALSVIVLLEMGAFIAQATRPFPVVEIPTLKDSSATQEEVREPESLEIPSLAQNASRKLFVSSLAAGSKEGIVAKAAPSASTSQLAARLTLMGIVSGDPPQAIIEDSQTRKTYFVSEGQPVAEGAVLEKVLDDRVLLRLGEEPLELTL